MAPQTLVIENSAEPKRSVCRGPTSMFRVYLPQSLLAETYEHAKFCELDSQLGEFARALLRVHPLSKIVNKPV